MSNFSLSPLFRRSIGFDRFNDLLIMQCKVRHQTIRITTLKNRRQQLPHCSFCCRIQ